MKTAMHVMLPDRPVEVRQVELSGEPSYEELKMVLGTIIGPEALMEHVSVLFLDKRADMFVDEEGHLKSLPYNHEATLVYQAASRRRGERGPLPTIVGAAAVFERQVWF